MEQPEAALLIPKLNPAIPLKRLEKILSHEEISIVQYLDGVTTCALIAKLLGRSEETLLILLGELEKRGIILFTYTASHQSIHEDFDSPTFSVSPTKLPSEESIQITDYRFVEDEDVEEESIPFSLLGDLTPAMAEASLNPQEIRLLVFIDGMTNVKSLSTLIGSQQEETILSLRNLAEKGFVRFKKRCREPASSSTEMPGFEAEEVVNKTLQSIGDGSTSTLSHSFSSDLGGGIFSGNESVGGFVHPIEEEADSSLLSEGTNPPTGKLASEKTNLSFEIDHITTLLDEQTTQENKQVLKQVDQHEDGKTIVFSETPESASFQPLRPGNSKAFRELTKAEEEETFKKSTPTYLLPTSDAESTLESQKSLAQYSPEILEDFCEDVQNKEEELVRESEQWNAKQLLTIDTNEYKRVIRKRQNYRTSSFLVRDFQKELKEEEEKKDKSHN